MLGSPVLVMTAMVLGAGAVYLLWMTHAISREDEEQRHFGRSSRFWLVLGLFGVVLLGFFELAAVSYGLHESMVGRTSMGLMGILPGIVMFTGFRHAVGLGSAYRRRQRAMAEGIEVDARVVRVRRVAFGPDMLSVMVEAELPVEDPGRAIRYRCPDPAPSVRARFTEICPGDHWGRVVAGDRLRLRVVPWARQDFAVLFFSPRPTS